MPEIDATRKVDRRVGERVRDRASIRQFEVAESLTGHVR